MTARAPRRIVLVLQSTAVGGMETHCVDLASEYVRRGIAVTAIVPERAVFDGLASRMSSGGAHVERLDTDARGGRRAQVARLGRLLALLAKVRPDVVHVQTGGATGGLAMVAAARIATPATVALTEHDVPEASPGRRQRYARNLLDRLAHAIVAVSRRNAALRRARLPAPAEKHASILNGVPVADAISSERDANRSRVRTEMRLAPSALVIGSLVRLAPGKGLDDLLRAFALLRAQVACELLLVGDGPLRGELEALASELGVANDVRFAGTRSDTTAFLDAMDVFVLAVPAGSMSIALLEAMGRGVPPVITFCGPEEALIDGETGLCAPPNDPEGLATVLYRIATDRELRERLGVSAAAHVRRHFSVRRVADDLLEVYAHARSGAIPERLRADGPPNPRPGDHSPNGARPR